MKVKIKQLDERSVVPRYSIEGDAGLDLVAIDHEKDKFGNHVYKTGLAIEIPEGYVGLLFPRSSISRTGMSLRNAVGVVDSNYREEILFKFSFDDGINPPYFVGERVAQLLILPYPHIELVVSDTLSDTSRKGGFGSTGV